MRLARATRCGGRASGDGLRTRGTPRLSEPPGRPPDYWRPTALARPSARAAALIRQRPCGVPAVRPMSPMQSGFRPARAWSSEALGDAEDVLRREYSDGAGPRSAASTTLEAANLSSPRCYRHRVVGRAVSPRSSPARPTPSGWRARRRGSRRASCERRGIESASRFPWRCTGDVACPVRRDDAEVELRSRPFREAVALLRPCGELAGSSTVLMSRCRHRISPKPLPDVRTDLHAARLPNARPARPLVAAWPPYARSTFSRPVQRLATVAALKAIPAVPFSRRLQHRSRTTPRPSRPRQPLAAYSRRHSSGNERRSAHLTRGASFYRPRVTGAHRPAAPRLRRGSAWRVGRGTASRSSPPARQPHWMPNPPLQRPAPGEPLQRPGDRA